MNQDKYVFTQLTDFLPYDDFLYIPPKTNFDNINELQIKKIQYKINNRPRQNLKFYSPKESFFLSLQNNVAFDT